MKMHSYEQSCATNATWPAACLHPIPLHAFDKPQSCVGDGKALLLVLVIGSQKLVGEAVYIHAGINWPAPHSSSVSVQYWCCKGNSRIQSVQLRAAQQSTAQHGTAWHGTMQLKTAQFSTTQHSKAPHSTTRLHSNM